MNKAGVAGMLKTASAAAIAMIALSIVPADAAETTEVGIVNMKFELQQVRIRPGVAVRWNTSERRTGHSVLFAQDGTPESERFFPGASWQRTFDKPGVYTCRCGPHPEMTGTVVVEQ